MAERASALLAQARKAFADGDFETPALDARVLFLHVTGLTHEQLIAEPEHIVSASQAELFVSYIARRLRREPVSKIIGLREFYGRSFQVSHDVLDPRADTESVITLALRCAPSYGVRFVDLGSGSGAIACTLLAERPQWRGVAVDVSAGARLVTQRNAESLGVSARLVINSGPWFAQCAEQFDLVVSNPPYIPHGDIAHLEDDVRLYDPLLALDGGADGLVCYRAIADRLSAHLTAAGVAVVEIGAGQQMDVTAVFAKAGFAHLDQELDLGGHVRALAFVRA